MLIVVLPTSMMIFLVDPPSKVTLLETTMLFASIVNRLILDVTSTVPFVEVNSAFENTESFAGILTVPPLNPVEAISVFAEKRPST